MIVGHFYSFSLTEQNSPKVSSIGYKWRPLNKRMRREMLH